MAEPTSPTSKPPKLLARVRTTIAMELATLTGFEIHFNISHSCAILLQTFGNQGVNCMCQLFDTLQIRAE
jgi:hypothetical protein